MTFCDGHSPLSSDANSRPLGLLSPIGHPRYQLLRHCATSEFVLTGCPRMQKHTRTWLVIEEHSEIPTASAQSLGSGRCLEMSPWTLMEMQPLGPVQVLESVVVVELLVAWTSLHAWGLYGQIQITCQQIQIYIFVQCYPSYYSE